MHWAEKSEKPPSLLTKTENQRLNWRKPAHDTKTEQKIGQIRKTENPKASLYLEAGSNPIYTFETCGI